ncbi:MAG: hypothetical protein NVSMB64_28150 [Candidatus Velthaea sp.]
MKHLIVRASVLLVALCWNAAPATAATPAAQALTVQLEGADPTLQSYRADVEFSVGLRTFPYLRKTVHGEAFFKRPNQMEIVFRDLPGLAARFKNVYVGLGSPAQWEKKYTIDVAQSAGARSEAESYLVMVPRNPDRRLQRIDVFLDKRTSLPARILWVYRDGSIEMNQVIVEQDGHNVIAAQVADIHLPGVHAVVNTKIANYAINAPIDDAVFTKKPAQQ